MISPQSFDPDTLAMLYQVFDDVWTALAPTIAPGFHLMARNQIAAVIVDDAQRGERYPELLWCHAMTRVRSLVRFYWFGQWGSLDDPGPQRH